MVYRQKFVSNTKTTYWALFAQKMAMCVIALATAGAATASLGEMTTDGLTGLWLFASEGTKLDATQGTALVTTDLITDAPANSVWMEGPWNTIGTAEFPTLYSNTGIVQEQSWEYLTCTHGISPNGGGAYVNEYTIAIDYYQTSVGGLWNGNYYNSLLQTSTANANDGDLFIKGSINESVIGIDAIGYSTLTFDPSAWHRIVLSVDNGSFFRVYVDGTLYLDGAAQTIDGRFSLDPTVLLFADNNWQDAWGMVSTVATWNRALTGTEIADMGGWIGGSATPTALVLTPEVTFTVTEAPEPATFAILGMGFFIMTMRSSAPGRKIFSVLPGLSSRKRDFP